MMRVFVFLAIFCLSCMGMIHAESTYQPQVSGSFYPSDPQKLDEMLTFFFQISPQKKVQKPRILIVPHAGYQYSGPIAAQAYKMLEGYRYETVVVVGFSHRARAPVFSIIEDDFYATPKGKIPLATDRINSLKQLSNFGFEKTVHEQEHSLEVQLPFLQQVLGDFRLVPIIMGDSSPQFSIRLAQALVKEFLDEDVLFVFSTDLSHYHPYEEANKIDKNSIREILTLDPQNVIAKVMSREIDGCGIGPIMTAVSLSRLMGFQKIEHTAYANSGDTAGNKDRVVGYYSLVLSEGNSQMNETSESALTVDDKKILLGIARKQLEAYYNQQGFEIAQEIKDRFQGRNGVFVSLKKNGHLRGCIGCFVSDDPLYKTVQDFVLNSALKDHRFQPVVKDELEDIEIEISVLSEMVRIESIDEIKLGTHGIYIRKGAKGGTFLPQVATDTGWTLEEFLGHCAQDKAGIGWDGWKDAEIYVYTCDVFSEKSI